MTAGRRDQLASALLLRIFDWRERDEIADALVPVVDRMIRQAQAEAVQPFEELFAGGPDTACRTTWRPDEMAPECSAASVDCVEVPMSDLRDAFARAAALRLSIDGPDVTHDAP